MTVRNWTVNRGYFGDDIIIQAVGENFVEVAAPDSKTGEVTSVRVPQQDFEYVYTNWDAYLAGDMTRHELRDNCRNTRYVIDVLRHLSEQAYLDEEGMDEENNSIHTTGKTGEYYHRHINRYTPFTLKL